MPTDHERWRYMPALDGLRAVAAIAVIGFHTKVPGFGGGFIGVEIFFVLSGYLITSILLREARRDGGIRYGAFWKRRVARLYPELLVVLAVYAAASLVVFPGRPIAGEVAAAALYVSNLVYSMGQMTFTRHMWSLAVEMQFYLAWPIVALILARQHRRAAVGALIAMFVIATAWRVGAATFLSADFAYRDTSARLSGLILGSLLAFGGWSVHGRTADGAACGGALALALVITLFPYLGSGAETWLPPIVDVAAAALVLALVSSGGSAIGRLLSNHVVVALGVWSYGIYLWHYPIAAFLRTRVPALDAFTITAVVSIILAGASYHLIARPAKRLIFPRGGLVSRGVEMVPRLPTDSPSTIN